MKEFTKDRPDSGGWWEWKEGGRGRVEKLLLTPSGLEVESDDEWEKEMGRNPSHDGFEENYWEGTETTQRMMPGTWRKLP